MKREESTVGEDFLDAKLRGMRGRIFEEERLRALAGARGLPELFRAVYPAETFAGHLDFERRLLADHIQDLSRVSRFLSGATLEIYSWLMVHYQLENAKLLLRAFLTRAPREEVGALLAPLPNWLALPNDKLLESADLRWFGEHLPVAELRAAIRNLLQEQEAPEPFRLEMALDRAYCLKLAKHARSADGWIRRLAGLDVDVRNILFLLRARFTYDYSYNDIRPYITASGIALTLPRAEEMAAAGDLPAAIARIPESCLPAAERPGVASLRRLEDVLRVQQYRLAKHCFSAAVLEQTIAFGFLYIKRIEFANLVRLTESVRQGLPREEIEAGLWR